MRSRIGDRQRLLHILDAIKEIENYISGSSEDDFMCNSMMKHACIKQIEIIGEAANLISSETQNIYHEVDWDQIVGMRNLLVHEYFGIDFKIVWQVITEDISLLKKQIAQILVSMDKLQ